jgi:hypothetical protein
VAVAIIGVMVPSVFADSMFKNSRNDPTNSYINNDYGFTITPPVGWVTVENHEVAFGGGSAIVGFANPVGSWEYAGNFGILSSSFDKSALSELALLSNSELQEMGQLMAEEIVLQFDNPKITNVSLKNYSDGVLLDVKFIHSTELSELTDQTWDDGTYVSLKRNSVMYLMDDGNIISINFSALANEYSLSYPSFKTSLKSFVVFDYATSNNYIDTENIVWDGAQGTSNLSPKLDENKNQNELKATSGGNGATASGGCLIATATYGSELAPQVQQLRELRDNQLLQTESGAAFMSTFNDIYYSFSPIIADMEREHPMFKEAVKLAITPMITSLSLMENAESESEVLSIGISVIMLNLGMYLGVPAIVVVGIRKKF